MKLLGILWLIQTVGFIFWINYLHGRINTQTNCIISLCGAINILDDKLIERNDHN